MMQADFDALKADFLEWTGGFEPESDAHVEVYLSASMPLALDEEVARTALRSWMRRAASGEVGRNVDQQRLI